MMKTPNRALLACALAMSVSACATTTTTLSLQELDCGSCSDSVTDLLKKQDGVKDADFRLVEAEVDVTHDPEVITAQGVRDALYKGGFDVVLGAGQGSYEKGPGFKPDQDVRFLTSTGQRVDLNAALVAGKITVVDFGADWCSPCRTLDEVMAGVLTKNPRVALRKVNIIDWESPVAAQHLSGVAELPYVRVYAPDGRIVATISGLKPDAIMVAIEEAGR
jgi:thiol-disulfide isomerase/thioredoxin